MDLSTEAKAHTPNGLIKPGTFRVIAGPCTVESYEQFFEGAKAVKESGFEYIRGGAFKPRTSPYSFQGLGKEGLEIMSEVASEFGLAVVTEVMDPYDIELVMEHADIIQIGARNMQNFSLLRRIGAAISGTSHGAMLKRGLAASVDEWLLAAEYITSEGAENVVLCERGIRTFETATRFTLDLSAVIVAKRLTDLPVIVDPSHAAGRRDLVVPLSKASVAAEADGLLVESHHEPENALCDAEQALSVEDLKGLKDALSPFAGAMGREVI